MIIRYFIYVIFFKLYLQSQSLTAEFSVDFTNGRAPLTVTFTDLSTASSTTISSWKWDFNNDGIIDSYEQNPTWIYINQANITVKLTISDGSIENSRTKSNYISVDKGIIQKKLTASDAATNNYFGHAVDVYGDYAIVGAYNNIDNSIQSGAAYIFKHNGTTWIQTAKLVPSDGQTEDQFAYSVAIYGNYAIIGSPKDDGVSLDMGSAYIFQRSGESWSQINKLTASDAAYNDYFGYSVDIGIDYAVIGAYQDNSNQGSAYIFKRNGASWSQHAKLTASDAANDDFYGVSVAISGDYTVVGSNKDDDNGSSSGSAYVYFWNGSSWEEQAKLTASDAAAFDNFGRSAAIDGSTIAIGAPLNDDNGNISGSAYIFTRNGASWSQQQILIPSNNAESDQFGTSISLSGNFLISGAYGKNSISGSAYIFNFSSTWQQDTELKANDAASSDQFSFAAAVHNGKFIVGAPIENENGSNSGAAYIHDLNSNIPANRQPFAENDNFSMNEEQTLNFNLLNNDHDPDSDSYKITALDLTNTSASVVINPDSSSVQVTGATNFFGTDSFKYTISDPGLKSATAAVKINITNINDAPVVNSAMNDRSLSEEFSNTIISANLNSVFRDPDGDILSFLFEQSNNKITTILNSGQLSVQSKKDSTGFTDIIVTAFDPSLVISKDTVRININPVNDPPVLSGIPDISFNEDQSYNGLNLNSYTVDSDDPDEQLSFSHIVASASSSATVSQLSVKIDSNSHLVSFKADSNIFGQFNVIFAVSDTNSFTNTDTITVTVNPVNDAPKRHSAIPDFTVIEDTSHIKIDNFRQYFSDIENDSLNFLFTVLNGPSLDSVSVPDSSAFVFLKKDSSGTINIEVTARDPGMASVTDTFDIIVNPVNDAPRFFKTDSLFYNEDEAIVLLYDSLVYDIDTSKDSLSINFALLSTELIPGDSIFLEKQDSLRKLRLKVSQNLFGNLKLKIDANDGKLYSNDTIIVKIRPVNDAPQIVSKKDTINVFEDDRNKSLIALKNYFKDPEQDSVIYSLEHFSRSAIDTLFIKNDSLFLTCLPDSFAIDDIIVSARDIHGDFTKDSIKIKIQAINDSPQIDSIPSIRFIEDSTSEWLDFSAYVHDIDNPVNQLSFKLVKDSSQTDTAALIIEKSSHSLFRFGALQDKVGVFQLTLQVTDIDSLSAYKNFNVEIIDQNDAPRLIKNIPDTTVLEDAPSIVLNLEKYIFDPDSNAHSNIYRIISNSDTSLIMPSFNANNMILNLGKNLYGQSHLVFEVNSFGLVLRDSFSITVTEVDDLPERAINIPDINVKEDSKPYKLNLESAYKDVDDNDTIFVSIDLIKDSTLFLAKLENDSLTISFIKDASGSSSLTLKVSSDGQYLYDTIRINVAAIDDPPFVENKIIDKRINFNTKNRSINLKNVFNDVDNDREQIDLTINKNTNPSLVYASIQNDSLYFGAYQGLSGVSKISIRASSNGKFVTETFEIKVSPLIEATMHFSTEKTLARNISIFAKANDSIMQIPQILINENNTITSDSMQSFSKELQIYKYFYKIKTDGDVKINVSAVDADSTISKYSINFSFHEINRNKEKNILSNLKVVSKENNFLNILSINRPYSDTLVSLSKQIHISKIFDSDKTIQAKLDLSQLNMSKRKDWGQISFYYHEDDKWRELNSRIIGNFLIADINHDMSLAIFLNKNKINIPQKFKLYQNYPNPFNPNTTIPFDINTKQKIRLLIYNVLGQKVKTLANRIFEAGYYDFYWNGKNDNNEKVSSGIYFYQIIGENKIISKKMVIIK